MMKNYEVELPKSKIVIKNNKYIYYTEKTYRNSDGKPRNKRTLIGKKVNGKMIPNQNYFRIFETEPLIIPDSIEKYGNTYLLKHIFEKLNIDKILKNNNSSYKEIMLIAMYMVCYGNSMIHIENWCEENYSENIQNISSQKVSEIFANLTYDNRMKFFKEWSNKKIEDEYLAYDITSISTYADIDIAEYGYNRDKENLPQINLGMYYGEKSRLPIYYNVYSGSITDKTELQYMLKDNDIVGINNIKYVMDKGFFSKQNLKYFEEKGLKIIIPTSFTLKYSKELVKEHSKHKITESKNRLVQSETFAICVNVKDYGIDANAHIYYTQQKDMDETNRLFEKIEQLEEQLRSLKEIPSDIKKYNKYFNIIKKENGTFKFNRKEDVINEEREKFGYLILLNNDKEMSSKETLEIYRNKDVIEKAFDSLKNELEMKRLRVHKVETMEGKIFVSFISLILKSYMQNKLDKYLKEKKLVLQEIINELSKIKVITKGKRKELMQPLTKIQKEIFSYFNITEEDIKGSLQS